MHDFFDFFDIIIGKCGNFECQADVVIADLRAGICVGQPDVNDVIDVLDMAVSCWPLAFGTRQNILAKTQRNAKLRSLS